MSDDMLWVLLVRMLERMLAVGVGGMSVYLGFRLFALMPDKPVGGADIKLPGGVSILVSRIGPGVFFSLFGAAIVSISLHSQITLPFADRPGTATAATSAGAGDPALREAERAQVERTLGDLAEVASLLPSTLEPSARNDAQRAIRAGRIALVYSVWGPDWGDFQDFRSWAESGATDVPAGAPWKRAAEMFSRRNPS